MTHNGARAARGARTFDFQRFPGRFRGAAGGDSSL